VKRLSVIILMLVLLASCATPKDFEYREIRNIQMGKFGASGADLTLDLVYFNPNGFGVDLKKIDCDVYVNNVYLGKCQLDTSMHIPRKAEFVLPTKVQVDMQSVLKNGLNMLLGREVLINVKGTTRVGRSGFYKTVPFNYEVKQTLKLFN
jgi:LEA14-like dessication related protein